MTSEPTAAGNGLLNFSLHAFDGQAAGTVEQLQTESWRGGIRSMQVTDEVDPETAARRVLDQALISAATPSLTAPVAERRVQPVQTDRHRDSSVDRDQDGEVPADSARHSRLRVAGHRRTRRRQQHGRHRFRAGRAGGCRPGRRHRSRPGAGGRLRCAGRLLSQPCRDRAEAELLLRPKDLRLAAGLHPRTSTGIAGSVCRRKVRAEEQLWSRRTTWTTSSMPTTATWSPCSPEHRACWRPSSRPRSTHSALSGPSPPRERRAAGAAGPGSQRSDFRLRFR